jgi:hypothetical protein
MSMLAFLIIGSLALITLGLVGWFLTASQVPENAAEHGSTETVSIGDQVSKDTFAPAEPGAEAMNPDRIGGDQSPPSS